MKETVFDEIKKALEEAIDFERGEMQTPTKKFSSEDKKKPNDLIKKERK